MSEEYSTDRYTELKPGLKSATLTTTARPLSKYHTHSVSGRHEFDFATKIAANSKGHHPDGVLLDIGKLKTTSRDEALQLLRQHVEENIVKIGKGYWQQKQGVSQGSVLSSLLCALCYADFEKAHLSFLQQPSLFLRLVDDFLLITPFQGDAVRFLRLMYRGAKSYGIGVSRSKCLASFRTTIAEFEVPYQSASEGFPYCGMSIDQELNLSKDSPSNWGAGESYRASFVAAALMHAQPCQIA